MNFYGSDFSNETLWNRRQLLRPARHIACPQRLKYIHDIKDGYIPYVEDSGYIDRSSSYRNTSQKTNRLSLYNTTDAWHQELMGLAQQVQSSLLPIDELQKIRLNHRRPKRSNSSMSTFRLEENDEENISKRLLNRHVSARYQRPYKTKANISIDKNEQESSINNVNQDPGIWLLPILCHVLQINNILQAQDWLVSANPTEKRLAMELISRKMQDMQNYDNDFISNTSSCDQSSTSSNKNNLYWPYKFWQHQQQSKLIVDDNDTCERATSPVRILTPLKRPTTTSDSIRSNQSLQTRCSTSRLLTPLSANNNNYQSRRNYHITTNRSTSTDRPMSTNSRGKTSLV